MLKSALRIDFVLVLLIKPTSSQARRYQPAARLGKDS